MTDFDPSPDDPYPAPLPFYDDEAEMLERRPDDQAGCTCDEECDEECQCDGECSGFCSCECEDR